MHAQTEQIQALENENDKIRGELRKMQRTEGTLRSELSRLSASQKKVNSPTISVTLAEADTVSRYHDLKILLLKTFVAVVSRISAMIGFTNPNPNCLFSACFKFESFLFYRMKMR
jgi:hypothetical protein